MHNNNEPLGATPPHNITAEQSLLGALLTDNDAFDRIAGLIGAEHFYSPEHRAIFGTIGALIGRSKPADIVTVYETGQHDLAYLNALAQSVPGASAVVTYAEVVRSRWASRQLIKIAGAAIESAGQPNADPYAGALQTQEQLAVLTDGTTSAADPQWLNETLAGHIDLITARMEGGGGQVFATGLHDFDKMLSGGMRPGRVYTIAARPSMGKTTLGLSIARHIAATVPVLFLTQEAPKEQLQDSILAACGNIALDKLLQPDPADTDLWSRIVDGVERARALHLLIDDQPSLRMSDVRHKVLAAQRKAKVGRTAPLAVVVVDYIQLMQGPGENRSVQIGAIANGLKDLALTNSVAIIALAQCNREADKKADGADAMSDINESGGIEAASDVVALIHREYVRTNDARVKDYGQLRVVKNRIGATGRVNLFFDGARQFFGSWSGPSPIVERSPAQRRDVGGRDGVG